MWKIFKRKDNADTSSESSHSLHYVDVNLLAEKLLDGSLQCPNCNEVYELSSFVPLSMTKCPECDSTIFVPHKIKNYWLYEPLGGGGMGAVYKGFCEDTEDDNIYAIKTLQRTSATNEYLIKNLIKEAEIGYAIEGHPHIAGVIEYGESEGEYFVVMQFVEGNRLDQLIDSPEKISQKFILLWMLQILSALQHLYQRHFLYRDMKPQNIIIDKSGNAVLIDFGLCLDIDIAAAGNTSDSVEGSPIYMPPERILGESETMASEVYSLGMVVYHALAKTTYYSASGAFSMAKKHVTGLRTHSINTKLTSVDARFVAIIDKMIARYPKDRYTSYLDLAKDVNNLFNSMQD